MGGWGGEAQAHMQVGGSQRGPPLSTGASDGASEPPAHDFQAALAKPRAWVTQLPPLPPGFPAVRPSWTGWGQGLALQHWSLQESSSQGASP